MYLAYLAGAYLAGAYLADGTSEVKSQAERSTCITPKARQNEASSLDSLAYRAGSWEVWERQHSQDKLTGALLRLTHIQTTHTAKVTLQVDGRRGNISILKAS